MTQLYKGDCLKKLGELNCACVDAIITDPPYGLSFMNNKWDYQVPSIDIWKECLRVIKPGGHLLSFSSARTYHRMACNIEDAGFEIRDQIMWIYGEGFPKSKNIGKQVDNKLGNKREVIKTIKRGSVKDAIKRGVGYTKDPANQNNKSIFGYGTETLTKGFSDWEGWGTGLKPAHEPIVLSRKPISEETLVKNVLKHKNGALNIDDCRVGNEKRLNLEAGNQKNGNAYNISKTGMPKNVEGRECIGRWPANLIHDGNINIDAFNSFFYCAKASNSDRGKENNHPTVKPIDLMRYLIRLVCPVGSVVLDPFMGSGTTGKAALEEGMEFIGIEQNEEYMDISKRRLTNVAYQAGLFT